MPKGAMVGVVRTAPQGAGGDNVRLEALIWIRYQVGQGVELVGAGVVGCWHLDGLATAAMHSGRRAYLCLAML